MSDKHGSKTAERSAVVRIRDKQIRVQANDVIKVPLLETEVGTTIDFDDVLMVSDDEIRVGTPTVEGARVRAEVLSHGREKKIIVFKFKRRKGYRNTQGHRQDFTSVRIKSIEG